jgi:SSS family solute:Na+ symporter
MSSLAGVFNSCSTLFTMDIYRKLRPQSSEKTLVRVGRLATGVVVLTGVLWIPLMKNISGELYHYLQSVQSYLGPPIAAVFLLGVFWRRINSQGAVTALVGGFALGVFRLVAELNKGSLSGWLYQFATVSFLYFCVALFLVCIAVMVTVSLLTRAPEVEKIQGLTYSTTVAADKASSRASWNRLDLGLSLIVIAVIMFVILYFSPLFQR